MTFSQEQMDAIEAAIGQRIAPINDRLDRGAQKMDELASSIGQIQVELTANTATTHEVRELLDVGKSGLKVLGWLGSGAKWTGGLAAAGLAIYSFFYAVIHGGQMPPKP